MDNLWPGVLQSLFGVVVTVAVFMLLGVISFGDLLMIVAAIIVMTIVFLAFIMAPFLMTTILCAVFVFFCVQSLQAMKRDQKERQLYDQRGFRITYKGHPAREIWEHGTSYVIVDGSNIDSLEEFERVTAEPGIYVENCKYQYIDGVAS